MNNNNYCHGYDVMTRPNDTDLSGVQTQNQPHVADRLLSGSSNAAEQHYQLELYKGVRFLQSRWQSDSDTHAQGANADLAASGPSSNLSDSSINQRLLRMLQARQTQAHSELQQALPGSAGAAPTASILTDLSASSPPDIASSSVLATVELTDRFFDFLRTDDALPEPSKNLLSYLYAPVLKVALIDPLFFEGTEHPARLLLNSLAEASARWISPDGRSQYDMYRRINAVVLRLLAEFSHDVDLFADVLLDFRDEVQNLAHRQMLLEYRALNKAQGEETLRLARCRAYTEVQRRIQGRELPSTVLLLLLQPWSDYLVFILLRSGDASNVWHEALRVIDDLLRSLERKQVSLERQPLTEISAGQLVTGVSIRPLLERGLASIDYEPATKGRTLLDALQSLQAMAQQGREITPAPASMRRKLETMVATRAGIDTDADDTLTAEELAKFDILKQVELGAWLDTDDGQRLKIAWQSPGTQHYLLFDQKGCNVALVSVVQLARDRLAGKTKLVPCNSKLFFERALESIYQHMNADIAARTGGGSEQ